MAAAQQCYYYYDMGTLRASLSGIFLNQCLEFATWEAEEEGNTAPASFRSLIPGSTTTARRWVSQAESLRLSVVPPTCPPPPLLLIDPSPLEGPLFLGLAAPVARQHHPAPPPLVVMAVSTCRLPPQSALSPAVVLAIHAGIDLVRSICFVTSIFL